MYSACVFFATEVIAGTFSVSCSGLQELVCAEQINDIVTDKFIKKFPFDKFQISLVMIQTANGITAARVSVAPNIGNKIGYITIGKKAWIFTDVAKEITKAELMKVKVDAIRNATQDMMEECEKTTNCEIYSSQ